MRSCLAVTCANVMWQVSNQYWHLISFFQRFPAHDELGTYRGRLDCPKEPGLCILLTGCTKQVALEKQDSSCTYIAHHQLESITIVMVMFSIKSIYRRFSIISLWLSCLCAQGVQALSYVHILQWIMLLWIVTTIHSDGLVCCSCWCYAFKGLI